MASRQQFCCIEHDLQEETAETSDVQHSKKVEKQPDYILTDKKHYSWSRDDTWAVTTDVLRLSLKFRRTKENLVTPRRQCCEREREPCEDGNEQKYRDLEQEVKEAEPGTSKAKEKEQKPEAGEDEAQAASAAALAATPAADGQAITKTHAEASEGAVVSRETRQTKMKKSGLHTRKEDDGEARKRANP